MPMRRRHLAPLVGFGVLASSCAAPTKRTFEAQTPLRLFDDAGRPNIGSLEHRGRRYDLRTLMDPAARRDGDSDFLRNFNLQDMYAGLWAGS
jgi:hypothetical protein